MCARTASVAVAGYYPTPADQLALIANLLATASLSETDGHGELALVDPCAGDGEAVHALARMLATRAIADDAEAGENLADKSIVYACEMEESRHKAMLARTNYSANHQRALHGDAFSVTFERGKGCGLLFLNPPYDTDRVAGRLEEKFLARFTDVLVDGGVLVYIVPHYALAASVATLARRYDRLSCWRFRGDGFDAYKQVVLLAVKRPDLFDADPETVAQIERWAGDASRIPELPDLDDKVPTRYAVSLHLTWNGSALNEWTMREIDLTSIVQKFRPWCESTRARGLAQVSRIIPDLPIAELLHRTYEVATPPRPAHIAAGIAAGLFNGRRIEPDDATSGLPPLLVKGVFDREWRTIEEKHSKEGEKTGEVQVQQPKLVVTILDLDSHKYHTVGASADTGAVLDVSKFGIGDLLAHYGASLMTVMEKQCKILYDRRTDAGKVEIAPLARTLFEAQAHAARACVTLLREREGRHPWLLGEIGSGKTTVSLAAAKTEGAKSILVVCPPHLLDGWKKEVAAVMPEAQSVVLESVRDVDALAERTGETVVAILSRETAKLGHGWESVADVCPKCGLSLVAGEDFARKRARCGQKTLVAGDAYARLTKRMALLVRPHMPGASSVRNYLRGRLDRLRARKSADGEVKRKWRGLPDALAVEALSLLAADYLQWVRDDVKRAILWVLAAAPDADRLRRFALLCQDPDDWQRFVEELLLLCPETTLTVAAELKQKGRDYYPSSNAGSVLSRTEERIQSLKTKDFCEIDVCGAKLKWKGNNVLVDSAAVGSVEAAERAVEALGKIGAWRWTPECDEPLYQAVPEPRRFPLAQYIVNHRKHAFDFLILDEGHEYATDGSAQERAAHRLTTLGLPTILMTGSVMNGYATSMFTNMWALAPEFRDEFDRREQVAFCDRYGYRKRFVCDREEGEVVAFGSQSDRVERSERDVGMAPGILPLFLFRHLLPSAVTLHKADLRINLPPLDMEPFESVEAGDALLAEYKRLLKALTNQIKADRFVEDKAGKLFGALSELPSFLDRATSDVGNSDDGTYEIRYPESLGGELVASAKMLPAKSILPKERWMLDRVEAELAEGRNVMVFAWHVRLLPRLQRLIQERIGESVPVLYADKVPTGKRQSWIDREIVQKNRRVMVANPVAIQTGLNNLVHFATEIWHENPACNPIVYRQAIGRIDRIGQKLPTRVAFAGYADTLQAQMYELLIAKVAVSTATDGLDPESALRASGIVEDEYLTGLSIGKQLWAMLSGEAPMPRPKLIISNVKPKLELRSGELIKPVAVVIPIPVAKGLNEKEEKVLAAIGTADALTIEQMAKEAFSNRPSVEKAKSWVRNSLRKLVERKLVEQVGRGTYALTAAQKAKVEA